jgi:hypothetical protein
MMMMMTMRRRRRRRRMRIVCRRSVPLDSHGGVNPASIGAFLSPVLPLIYTYIVTAAIFQR